MEHAEEAGLVGAEEAWIVHQRLDGLGGGREQRVVAQFSVAAQKRAQGLGHREGEHEVVAWQLALQSPLKPLLGLAVLALGAMAVAAGGREHVMMATVLALVTDRAIGLGAALADGLDDLMVLGGDVLAEVRQVLRPEAVEDLLDGTHLTALPSAC